MIYKKLVFILLILGVSCLFYQPLKLAVLNFQNQNVSYEYHETAIPMAQETVDLAEPNLTEMMKIKNKTAYMGLLEINSVDLEQFISPKFDNQSLFTGVVNLFPDRVPEHENIVIIGHHMADPLLFLGPILNVEIGQTIKLYFKNSQYSYEITEKYKIDEKNTAVMDTNNNEAKITLITCDQSTYTNKRLIVEGRLIEKKRSNSLPLITKTKHGARRIQVEFLKLVALWLALVAALYILVQRVL